MTYAVMLLVMTAAAIFQALSPQIALFGQTPFPVLFGVVTYYALTRERNLLLLSAVVAGLVQDSLSMMPLGYSSFAFVAVGWVINRIRNLLFVRATITHVLCGAVGHLAVTLLLFLLLAAAGYTRLVPGWVAARCFGAICLGAVTVPLVFRLTAGLDRRVGNFGSRGGYA